MFAQAKVTCVLYMCYVHVSYQVQGREDFAKSANTLPHVLCGAMALREVVTESLQQFANLRGRVALYQTCLLVLLSGFLRVKIFEVLDVAVDGRGFATRRRARS